VKDLPGLADLKAQGLLDGHLPPGFTVPDPTMVASLMPDELPLEDGAEEGAESEDEEALEEERDDLEDEEGDEGAAPSGAHHRSADTSEDDHG
jgi:segregation and condensation protein B